MSTRDPQTPQLDAAGALRHLIRLDGLSREFIAALLDRAESFQTPVGARPARSTVLTGRTVANLFFEPSTRTRASFELAAKRLSADVLNLDVNMSSRTKGESLLDTMYTLQAMQVDVFVVRDASSGIPDFISGHVLPHVSVLNAGEASVSHPTQGLLDLLTIRQQTGRLTDLTVTVIGDIAHSRVARSLAEGLRIMGDNRLRLVSPTGLTPDMQHYPQAQYTDDVDAAVADADVVMALRIQRERIKEKSSLMTSVEYHEKYGLTEARLKLARPDAIVMHPGPMNRDVEIAGPVADGPQSMITAQVHNGLAVRMAVLAAVTESRLT